MTLKVELPPTGIVRTISVPECMTLEDLHEAIQAVMGWEDEHLWHFAESLKAPCPCGSGKKYKLCCGRRMA